MRCASSASGSTRCPTPSRNWPGSACWSGSTRWRSAPTSCSIMNRFGQEIWREPRGLAAGYDVPQFSIHRGRLHGVIHQAVRARIGEGPHSAPATGSAPITQDEGGVTAYLFDRSGHRATARGDVLIGCDGIHSARSRDAVSPRPPGTASCCGVAPPTWPAFMTGRSMIVAGGNAAKIRHLSDLRRLRCPDASSPIGRRWSKSAICQSTAPQGRLVQSRAHGKLMPVFGGFKVPQVNVITSISSKRPVWEYPLLRPRSAACLAQAGSPCSAMPHIRCIRSGSNGASQAMFDARCLADALSAVRTPPPGAGWPMSASACR